MARLFFTRGVRLFALWGLVCFMPGASAAAEFGIGDLKGIYVASISGNFADNGDHFAGYVYFNANGQGKATGSWQITDAHGSQVGSGLADPAFSHYTVEPDGLVRLFLQDQVEPFSFFAARVYIANAKKEILGLGGFAVGSFSGVGTVRGIMQ